jgi:hypothetical protein
MIFEQVKEFFLSWGMDVSDEWKNQIAYANYPKLRDDATRRYGSDFGKFVSRITETTDSQTYVCAYSWDVLETSWIEYMAEIGKPV